MPDAEQHAPNDDEEVIEEWQAASSKAAISYMERFFASKTLHVGGPIPRHMLVVKRNVEIVRRLELSVCIEAFHLCLLAKGWKLNDSIKLALKLQKESFDMEIPKQHSGGLLLVYLNLCKGCRV